MQELNWGTFIRHFELVDVVVKVPAYEWEGIQSTIPSQVKSLVDTLKKEEKALRWLEVFPLMAETAQCYSQYGGWHPETGEKQ